MSREILIALFAVLSIEGSRAALVGSSEINIGFRGGSDLLTHVNQATYMMQTGNHYRVVSDQIVFALIAGRGFISIWANYC